MSVFYLKRGDTQPIMDVSLNDPDGTDYDASGATVSLHVKLPTGTLVRAMTVVDGPTGLIRYTWVADDWNYLVPGLHRMEYQVTPSGGGTITFPNNGYDFLSVAADLDSLSAPVALNTGAILLETGSTNTKISALTSGAPVLPTDEIVVARSGVNRKLLVPPYGLSARFPGVEYVFYGAQVAGFPAPDGPGIVLTAAQFRAINSAPQTLIPAIAGFMTIPVRTHIRKEAGSGFVAGPNTGVQLRLGSGTGQQVGVNITLATLRFDQTSEEAALWLHASTTAVFAVSNLFSNGALSVQNQPVVLFGASGDMASDGSPVHISILAELWPVVLA